MGVEEKGKRPKPGSRGELAVIIYKLMERDMRLMAPQISHEIIWGVPVGPVLTMVHPTILRGISVQMCDKSLTKPNISSTFFGELSCGLVENHSGDHVHDSETAYARWYILDGKVYIVTLFQKEALKSEQKRWLNFGQSEGLEKL